MRPPITHLKFILAASADFSEPFSTFSACPDDILMPSSRSAPGPPDSEVKSERSENVFLRNDHIRPQTSGSFWRGRQKDCVSIGDGLSGVCLTGWISETVWDVSAEGSSALFQKSSSVRTPGSDRQGRSSEPPNFPEKHRDWKFSSRSRWTQWGCRYTLQTSTAAS